MYEGLAREIKEETGLETKPATTTTATAVEEPAADEDDADIERLLENIMNTDED